MDMHDAAANALRTAWLNGKANTTEGWALHVEAALLVDFIREQIAREIEAVATEHAAHDLKTAMHRAARIARGES